MKTTRPSFAVCLAAWVCAGFASRAEAQQRPIVATTAAQARGNAMLAAPSFNQLGSAAAATERESAIAQAGQQADALVEQVRQLIESYNSIECATRHTIELFDHEILGTGHYLQQGRGLRRMTRFECRSQIDNRTESLIEIADGQSFWTLRETSAGAALSKVSIERVAEAWDQYRQAMPAAAMRDPAVSGLPRLLDSLIDQFNFRRISGGQLGNQPVWIIEGFWKPDKLIAAAPDQKPNIESGRPIDLKRFPGQLPERIVLEVAKSNLFPCRLEYLRRASSSSGRSRAGEGSGVPGYRMIVEIKWFDVYINRPIDPKVFVYQPSIQATDGTDRFLKSLNLTAAQAK